MTAGSGSGPTPGNAAANLSRTRSASSPRSRRMSLSAPAIAPAPSASKRAVNRWATSWSSPSATMSPAPTDGAPAGRTEFIRAARCRIAARSATTRSPRAPRSASSMAWRSRAVRRTWNSRIGPKDGTRSPRASDPERLGRTVGGDVVDGAAEQLQSGRVELVRPRPDTFRPAQAAVEAGGQCLARHQDQVGVLVDLLERVGLARQGGHDLDAGRAGQT